MKPFTSRKFLLALGACLTAIGAALSGTVTWDAAFGTMVTVIVAYITAEGLGDVASRFRNGK